MRLRKLSVADWTSRVFGHSLSALPEPNGNRHDVCRADIVSVTTSPQEAMALRNARFAPLTGRPITDEGRAVVARLSVSITQQETRTYARRRTSAQFTRAIGAFAADLLLAQGHKTAKGWIHRSLRDESFDNGPLTRTQAKAVWKGLVALGLVRLIQGYTRFRRRGPVSGSIGFRRNLYGCIEWRGARSQAQ